MKSTRFKRKLVGVVLALFFAVCHRVSADFETASYRVQPYSIGSHADSNQSTASFEIRFSVGGISVSSMSLTTSRFHPGLMNILSAPGAVVDFESIDVSSLGARVSWSSPGADFNTGDLGDGSRFFIQVSTSNAVDWGFAWAQISLSTSGIGPGEKQEFDIEDLFPNTTYYARLWTRDPVGNLSPPSNQVSFFTLAAPTEFSAVPILSVGVSSVTLQWNKVPLSPPALSSNSCSGYLLQASTASDFGGTLYSSMTTDVDLSTLSVTALNSDTTYFFRLGTLNGLGEPNFSGVVSTVTLVSTDLVSPGAVTNLVASTLSNTSLTLSWTLPEDATNNPLSGSYRIQVSTWSGIEWSTAQAQVSDVFTLQNPGTAQSAEVPGLMPNTSYYAVVWISDTRPNWSPLSNGATMATLSNAPEGISLIEISSVQATVGWDELPANPSSSTASGYVLEASTTNFGSLFPGGVIRVATATNVSETSLTLTTLIPNTTTYFRVGSLNRNHQAYYANLGPVATLAKPPSRQPVDILSVSSAAVQLHWVAMAVSPDEDSSEGYALQASSTAFDGTGNVLSSATTNVLFSTLTVSGLLPNRLYAFRVGSKNWSDELSWTLLESTRTLAEVVSEVQFGSVDDTQVVLSWTLPATSVAGVRIEASSTNFNGTGVVLSSSSASPSVTELSVDALSANTTYYFRVGSLNDNAVPNWTAVYSTITLANNPVQLASDFLNVFSSSITARWAALPSSPPSSSAEGYLLEASSTNFDGSGTVYSSQTLNVALSTLTITGLSINTTYYFRVGSLAGSGAANYTGLSATSTLVNTPIAAASTFTVVSISSIGAQWQANGNPSGTTYRLETSTASNFSTAVQSVTSQTTSALFESLTPNTTLYFRVFALNHNSVDSESWVLGSTVTWASPPSVPSVVFGPVNRSSLTVNFLSGSPSNPTGTLYQVQLSSISSFDVVATSQTLMQSSTFTALNPNTTYYARARGLNHGQIFSEFVDLGQGVTLAANPGVLASTYSNVAYNSLTFGWSSGTVTEGFNPEDTIYQAQISLVSNFSSVAAEQRVTDLSASFSGLTSNTVYYARVRALNHEGISTDYTSCGSTTTPSSSSPAFLYGTFEVSNSAGQFVDSAYYTNLTSPTFRVQVRSNISPGLSVTDVPSHLTRWPLDEGSGSTGFDASRHNRNLTLSGSPTWITGTLGGGVDFNGSSQYGVSGNLTPWRSNATNNQWSVSLWFRTTLARGFLFQTASQATLGGATYDAEISWYDSTGKLSFEVTTTGGTRRYIQATESYGDGNWHFLTAVLNTGGMLLFVDGSQVASGTQVTAGTARTYANSYAWVGAATAQGANMGGGNYQYYPGDVDEVLISTVALTLQQHQDFYALETKGIAMGAPQVEISTDEGMNNSWVRTSTISWQITGTAGTTSVQTFTSTLSLAGISLLETESPAADTNRVAIIASSLDSNQATAYYTILVDTTSPTDSTITSVPEVSSYSVTLNWSASSDALSGLATLPYRVEISTNDQFSPSQFGSETADTSQTLSSLYPNTTYYFRVLAIDAAGNEMEGASVSTVTWARPIESASLVSVYESSASWNWTAFPATPSSSTAWGYLLEASSTSFDGTGLIRSSMTNNVALNMLVVENLLGNTTHMFRISSLNWLGVPTTSVVGTTSTWAGPPQSPELLAVWPSSMTIQWSVPSSGASGFDVQASTAFDFSGELKSSVAANGQATQLTIQTLSANTTYYLRVGAINHNGVRHYSVLGGTSTLTNTAQNPQFLNVYVSSISVQWTVPSGEAASYQVEASTSEDYVNAVIVSTDEGSANVLVLDGLTSNTTYYVRVAALNWSGIAQYAAVGSTVTDVSIDPTAPYAVNTLSASTESATSLRLRWLAALDSTNNPLTGQYAIQTSTWLGVVWATSSAQVLFSTTAVPAGEIQETIIGGLLSNTTYFIKLWTSDIRPNWSYESNVSTRATLAGDLADVAVTEANTTDLSVGWGALAASPPYLSAEGYLLEASTAADFGGAVSFSSTTDVSESTLTITGILANTTYYLRAASLNWVDAPNYSSALSTITLAPVATRLSSDFLNIYESSASVRWAALPSGPQDQTGEGYRLEGSSTNFSGGTILSSQTSNITLSTLTIVGLSANTTYYYRVGSLNWENTPNYVSLNSTSSLARAPTSLSSTYTAVHVSSLTAQWSGNNNPSGTRYRVEISSMSSMSPLTSSSITLNTEATLTSLLVNTTYYLRVAAINHNEVETAYQLLGSTTTRTSAPTMAETVFSPVNSSSLTVNFANGSPSNPAGTIYRIEVSSLSNFSVVSASQTMSYSSTFTALSPNTTYYARGRSVNQAGTESENTSFGSKATLAVLPGAIVSTYSVVTYNGFTVNWTSGTPQTGYNAEGTVYEAQISLVSNFASITAETSVTDLSASFSGLVSDTVYYVRVRAVNHEGFSTDYRTYNSTRTSVSAIPAFLAGSFKVSNSQGVFQEGTLYTDTTTPSIQVQVQSNASPGLAVTDVPSHLTRWPLDEGSGSTGFDASRHNRNLTLSGSPTWITGTLGGGVDFNGSSQYGVSGNLTPWRSNATNNEWSVSLWFRTTLGRGFIFQTASQATLGGATYDAEISWYDSTGKLSFAVTTSGGVRQYIQADQSYADGNWHLVTAVLNTGGMVMFVDGTQAASGTGVTSTTARTYANSYAWVGAATAQGANMGGGNYQYYPGDVDEVLISTVALTLQQHQDFYALETKGIAMGAPQVEISTDEGVNNSWVRTSTISWQITGTAGTTSVQTFTSTLSLAGISLLETESPAADTNRVAIIASSLDSNQATAYYTILVDTTSPTGHSLSDAVGLSTDSIQVTAVSGTDGLSGIAPEPYNIELSTDPGFSGSQFSGYLAGPSTTFVSLPPNTTSFFRLRVRDTAGNVSAVSSSISETTLAKTVSSVQVDEVYLSSVSFSWTPRPVSPSSETAAGYVLQVSSVSDFSVISVTSAPVSSQVGSWTANDLYGDTTYYFRVGSLNWAGATNYSTSVSTYIPPQFHIELSTDVLPLSGELTMNTSVVISSYITVTNRSNVNSTFEFRATTATAGSPWSIALSQSTDQFVLWMVVDDAAPVSEDFGDEDRLLETISACSGTSFSNGGSTCVSVPPGESRTVWFKLGAPTMTTTIDDQAIRLTVTAGSE